MTDFDKFEQYRNEAMWGSGGVPPWEEPERPCGGLLGVAVIWFIAGVFATTAAFIAWRMIP